MPHVEIWLETFKLRMGRKNGGQKDRSVTAFCGRWSQPVTLSLTCEDALSVSSLGAIERV